MGPSSAHFFNKLRWIGPGLGLVGLLSGCSEPAGGQARRGSGTAVAIHSEVSTMTSGRIAGRMGDGSMGDLVKGESRSRI